MDNENSTVQEVQSGEQAEVVAPQSENRTEESVAGQEPVVAARSSDFDLVETDDGEEGTTDPEDNPMKEAEPKTKEPEVKARPEQSREENAAIRAARLRARREAEAEAQRAAEERFTRAGIVNPQTGKPFGSLKEWEDYASAVKREQRAEEAKKTGRSVEELEEDEANRAFLTRMRKEAEQRQRAEQTRAERRAFLEQDALDFIAKYPQMGVQEVAKLEQDKAFRQFCGSRFGREPLGNLYADYLALVGGAGKAAVAKAATKAARATGSGAGGGAVLSPTQKNALDAWNAEYPEMAMTAKEFLGR
ncbi:MAG: hypothetical protein IJQ98_05105 [Oscillospiraceae bacterium]|nr:hypothetical protein [Oscillospiraceae bacterium]